MELENIFGIMCSCVFQTSNHGPLLFECNLLQKPRGAAVLVVREGTRAGPSTPVGSGLCRAGTNTSPCTGADTDSVGSVCLA